MPAFAAYRGLEHASSLTLKGELAKPSVLGLGELVSVPRVEQVSDLHCVTTWSCCGIRWSGFRFRDVHEQLLQPRAKPLSEARWVGFRGADGHRASLLLEDALRPDVLLADQMNGEALSVEHGAPLRLIAPSHYAYKSVKHIVGIEFWSEFKPGPGLLEHPRARVDFEERGRLIPGRLLRHLYRPFIAPVTNRFRVGGT
jgi:DMSO/TMAO reductase YedYZ molybdopterin-dependent catalytic subunit